MNITVHHSVTVLWEGILHENSNMILKVTGIILACFPLKYDPSTCLQLHLTAG